MSDRSPVQTESTIGGDLGDGLSAELPRTTQEHEAGRVGPAFHMTRGLDPVLALSAHGMFVSCAAVDANRRLP